MDQLIAQTGIKLLPVKGARTTVASPDALFFGLLRNKYLRNHEISFIKLLTLKESF